MKRDRTPVRAAMLVVIATLGCSSSASVPPFHPTAAQGGASLSQLTPDQIHMVCEAQAQYEVDVASSPIGRQSACQGLAWVGAFQLAEQEQHLVPGMQPSTADLQKACEDLEAGCLRSPPGPIFPQLVDPCAQASSIVLTSCEATLDQYAACVSDLEARHTNNPPCSRLTASIGSAPPDAGEPVPLPLPASCATFWASCPPLANNTLESQSP